MTTLTIKAMVKTKLKILQALLKRGGEIEFSNPIFPTTFPIKKIRVVKFEEDISDLDLEDDYAWNDYANSVHRAIGVKNYCVWVRNKNGKMKGIMAFYDDRNNEIKMKHFDMYKELLKKLI